MRSSVTIILELLIRVASWVILNVAFVANAFTETMSYIHTAGTSTKNVTYVIAEIKGDSSSIIWTTILWSNISDRITFCVQTRNVWTKSL